MVFIVSYNMETEEEKKLKIPYKLNVKYWKYNELINRNFIENNLCIMYGKK